MPIRALGVSRFINEDVTWPGPKVTPFSPTPRSQPTSNFKWDKSHNRWRWSLIDNRIHWLAIQSSFAPISDVHIWNKMKYFIIFQKNVIQGRRSFIKLKFFLIRRKRIEMRPICRGSVGTQSDDHVAMTWSASCEDFPLDFTLDSAALFGNRITKEVDN